MGPEVAERDTSQVKSETEGKEEEEGRESEGESGGGAAGGARGRADGGAVSPDSAVPPTHTLLPRAAELQARRLTPDLPESLFELLFQSQGRRLNDQRCSFRRERGREGLQRGWQSEPSTPVEKRREVFFSSMTSLQTEEFFEMVANSQGRRLDNQRAELQEPPPPSAPACENEATVEGAGSEEAPNLGVTEGGAEKKAANEELYSMILSYQVQGRIDEQRSRPPGPVDDEGFFSLLLRVQGGRMEEQRVELPEGLLRRVNSH
ncbi:G-protein-signaling modulator 1-like [Acipenser ruthenus]|uniref:G-protein-signaling modulator 1-like n=1 Tax=Acipenser ruthenus TaxID=7906 RepID=UPI0015611522|nr:G-protein-signaling modulator 1-like [Acipenser ruthenus]